MARERPGLLEVSTILQALIAGVWLSIDADIFMPKIVFAPDFQTVFVVILCERKTKFA